jgi:hypothetical protein
MSSTIATMFVRALVEESKQALLRVDLVESIEF